jgi:hypothetical protein
MPDRVWYASYGSNLLKDRFMKYIQGGRPPGAAFEQVGCTDPTPPTHDRGIMILHRLFFAEAESPWEDGGVAFVQKYRDEGAKTLGRMYLITAEQFIQVLLQENGHRRFDVEVRIDLDSTVKHGRSETGVGLYGTLLHLGEEAGHPIFTFTASWEEAEAPINPPGPRYLGVIAQGLKETFGLSTEGVTDYLRNVPGIQGSISDLELAWVVGGGRS